MRDRVRGDLTPSILAEEARYGLAVKRELEHYYGSDVNHGRLYPNLDELVEMGLVEKSEMDKLTNQYALTVAKQWYDLDPPDLRHILSCSPTHERRYCVRPLCLRP